MLSSGIGLHWMRVVLSLPRRPGDDRDFTGAGDDRAGAEDAVVAS